MYTYFKSRCVYLSIIFIINFDVLNLEVVSVNFVKYSTGFNPLLNSFQMQSTITRSRMKCGSLCEEEHCTSFIFNATQKLCTLYSVYMTHDDGDMLDQYYVRSNAEEHVYKEEVETCSSGNIPNTGTNVALHKNVAMSSNYGHGSSSSFMVDGSRSSTWPCASTHSETRPHATVDLLQSYEINAIYIVNRGDCCPERLHHFVVKIGDDMSSLETAFNHTNAIGADCTVIFDTPRRGRYVRLQIEATEYLTVCELEVYSIV